MFVLFANVTIDDWYVYTDCTDGNHRVLYISVSSGDHMCLTFYAVANTALLLVTTTIQIRSVSYVMTVHRWDETS